jgi:hypothetical protein
VRALAAKALGNGTPDATASPGHDDDFADETSLLMHRPTVPRTTEAAGS